mmetsp:Transcript_21175/g.58912  ORF Transcript_21175/g.58912 Transcript_21175/m.58912 type:complete len:94 (-) Transcript_21175:127-408(-)
MPTMAGGYTANAKPVTPEIADLVAKHRQDAETKLGETFDVFEAVEYTQQVVAGMNYKVKVKIRKDDSFIEVDIFQSLPCNGGDTKLKKATKLN